MDEWALFSTMSAWQLYVVAAGLVVCLSLETVFPLVKPPSGRVRLQHLARNAIVWGASTVIVSLLFGQALVQTLAWLSVNHIGVFRLLPTPLWVQIVVGVLALDLCDYVFHRLSHQTRWLWLLHSVHHSDPAVDVSTNLRAHPLHIIATLLAKLPVVAAFGFPLWVLLLRELLAIPIAQLQHANLRLPDAVERFLQPFLITPDLHKVHHAPDAEHNNWNFGGIFSFWDRWFGTDQTISRDEPPRYGLESLGSERWQSIWGMLLTPVRARRIDSL